MQSSEPKPIVLLVDDSADMHRLVRARLRHEHLELIDASSGLEGLETARSRHPSAILLDLDMPQMDGFEVLRALKAKSETATIPVIVLSGMRDTDDKVSAFDLGAADFVTKSFDNPADVAELKARLRSVLRLERLLRLLAERAELDGLTGMGNRTQFNRRWAEEVSGNKRYGHPLSICILDIDHFKRINDTYGHPAGDELLSGFARLLQSSCRSTDIACRYGGEEFALIMPNTPPSDAFAVADRIRAALAAVVWPRHPEHKVTVSIGVAGAEGPAASASGEHWIELADRALYSAKNGGRNRVVAADPIAGAVALAKAG